MTIQVPSIATKSKSIRPGSAFKNLQKGTLAVGLVFPQPPCHVKV